MTAAALQPAQAKAPAAAAAPPVFAPAIDSGAFDTGPIGSLSQVPLSALAASAPIDVSAAPTSSVQRKCETCGGDEVQSEGDHEEVTTNVRPRLEVGAADDPFEREADAIAGQVMALRDSDVARSYAEPSAAPASVQRACSACSQASRDDEVRARRANAEVSMDEEEAPRMQGREACARPRGGESIAASHSDLTSGGSALPEATRTFFEDRMGRDLSDVRLHTGHAAHDYSTSIGAKAFTYENHIWLGKGETTGPSFTMAHELAHVLQQTSPGPVGPEMSASGGGVMARRRQQATADKGRSARRFVAFWQPLGAQAAQLWGLGPNATQRHSALHNDVQSRLVGANRRLVTEVRIPGASTSSGCGYADLYISDNGNVPGLEPDGAGGLRNLTTRPLFGQPATSCLSTWNFHQMDWHGGHGTAYHHSHRYPRINAAGAFTNCNTPGTRQYNRAPKDIWIGDVKPGHNESARSAGQTQVQDYIDGIRDTAALTGGCWTAQPRVMTGNQINIPRNLQPNRRGGWDIPALELRLSSGLPGGADVYRPTAGPRGGAHRIRGRVSAVKDRRYHSGIWVYFVEPRPGDLQRQFGRSGQNPNFRPAAARLRTVLDCLKSHPNRRRSLCRRVDPNATSVRGPIQARSQKAGPASIRTSSGVAKVRRRVPNDTSFRFSTWNAMRVGSARHPSHNQTNLRHILNRDVDRTYREQIQFQAAVARSEDYYDTTYGSSNHTSEPPAGTSVAGPNGILSQARKVEKYEFWTDNSPVAPAALFGRLRATFGNVFVRAVAAYEKLKQKSRRAFRNTRMRGGGGSALAAVARKVGVAVLSSLGSIMLRKIGMIIQQCLERGFTEYMTSLIEGDSLDALRTKFGEAQTLASNLRDDVMSNFEDIAERIIAPIRGWLDEIAIAGRIIGDVVAVASTLARGLRVGTCLSGLSAAGVGAIVTCLASALDLVASIFGVSPIDWVVGRMMESCRSRRMIARVLMSSDLVQRLPQRIARELITQLRDELPEGAKDILCDPDSLEVEPITMDDFQCVEGGSWGGGSSESGGDGDLSSGRSGGQASGTEGGEGSAPTQTSSSAAGDADDPPEAQSQAETGAQDADAPSASAGEDEESAEGGVSPAAPTTTTNTLSGTLDGEVMAGTGVVESGVSATRTYNNDRRQIVITMSDGSTTYSNQAVTVIVVRTEREANGTVKVHLYFPSNAAVTFCQMEGDEPCPQDLSQAPRPYRTWSPTPGSDNVFICNLRGTGP